MGKRLKALRIFIFGGDLRTLNSPTENLLDPEKAREIKLRKKKIADFKRQHEDNNLSREEEVALRNIELDINDRELNQDERNKSLEDPKDKWLEILKVILPHVEPYLPALLIKLGITNPKDALIVGKGVKAVKKEMDKGSDYIG